MVVDDLVSPDTMDKVYDHEVADPSSLPRILSFPTRVCSGLDFDYPIGDRRRDYETRRSNDEALFRWFAQWSLEEVRMFRRFHVVSGEDDKEHLSIMHSSWTREWRYISFGPGSEFMEGHKVNDWYAQLRKKKAKRSDILSRDESESS